jgi:lipopolysaccharide export system permease protein
VKKRSSDRPPQRRRVFGTLLRYVARQALFPTSLALAGFTFVVLSQQLLGWTDLVINRGLGVGTVGRIAFFEAVPQAARTLPFAVLVGSLMALGRLGADGELLGLEAAGVSARELLVPLAAFAALATPLSLGLSVLGAPAASRALDAMLEDLARERPGAAIRPNRVHRFGDWKLEAREVSEGGDRLRGVLLWIPGMGETIFAERGALDATGDRATQLTLDDAMLLLESRGWAKQLRFEQLVTRLPETEFVPREPSDRIAGRRLGELVALAKGASAEESRPARIELHRRFALSAATLLFGVLALPLLLLRARPSRAGGAVLGIVATLAYYGVVELGNGLIQAGWVGVVAGVWLPDLAFGAATLLLLRRLGQRASYGMVEGRPGAGRRRWRRGGERAAPKPERHRFILPRYVASRFLEMAALGFATLLAAYLLVDVLERLEFFARYAASAREVGLYYGARIPVLASRIIPMALLLAAALTVSLFAARNELLGMQVSGIPGVRAMLPVLVLSALMAPVSFLVNDRLVPGATARWRYVKNVLIKGRAQEVRPDAVWYRLGDHVYEAKGLYPELGTARDVVVYELGPNGQPVARTDARTARYVGHGVWSLGDAVRVTVTGSELRHEPPERFAELGERAPDAEVETSELSIGELGAEIRELEASGYDATPLRVDYYAKLAAPLACLVLPALVVFFALSGPPYPSPALTLMFGILLAVGYVLVTGAGRSLGYGGRIPPLVAGAGPGALLALLAAALGLRLHRFGREP